MIENILSNIICDTYKNVIGKEEVMGFCPNCNEYYVPGITQWCDDCSQGQITSESEEEKDMPFDKDMDVTAAGTDPEVCGYCGVRYDDPNHDSKACEKEAGEVLAEMASFEAAMYSEFTEESTISKNSECSYKENCEVKSCVDCGNKLPLKGDKHCPFCEGTGTAFGTDCVCTSSRRF